MKYALLIITFCSAAFAHNYHGCALAPDNLNGWAVCLDTSLILHTTDGGQTWQAQNPPNADTRFFMDVNCVDALHAWTGGKHYFQAGEICATANGGTTWEVQWAMFAKYATRIEFIDMNYGWAACGDGVIMLTTDGGSNWVHENFPTLEEFYGVSFVNTMDGWIVAGWPDTLVIGQGVIARASDGGHIWTEIYRTTDYGEFLDVYFFNLLEGIVVGGDDQTFAPIIMKTTDGGINWNPITCPANTYYLRAVDFVDNEGWAVGKHGSIIYTSDYGDSWVFQDNPAESTLFDVDFSDNLHGLACGYDTIFWTTDGGQTWHPDAGITDNQVQQSQAFIMLEVFPNPCRGTATIRLQAPSTNYQTNSNYQTELKIFDVTGRLVKFFSLPTAYSLLATTVSWDGTDDFGRKVPGGIYFVRLATGNQDCDRAIKVLLLQ